MKKIAALLSVSILYAPFAYAAAGSKPIAIIPFDGIPKGTPFYDFVENPRAFELSLGTDHAQSQESLPPMTRDQICRRISFTKQLTQHPSERTKALMLACNQELPISTSLIVSSGVSLDQKIRVPSQRHHSTFLCNAVGGSIAFMKKLISLGASVDLPVDTGETPLYLAVGHASSEKVSLLLDHGANPNLTRLDGIPPLYLAAERGYVDIINLLLTHKAEPNAASAPRSVTPLLMAAQHGHASAALSLLQAGAAVDQTDISGSSALLFAAEKGYPNIVDLLLKHGASPDLVNTSGNTALTQAAFHNESHIIKLLLCHGANPNFQTTCVKGGNTPLLLAVFKNNTKAVKALLNARWNPMQLLSRIAGPSVHTALDAPNAQGIWPLFIAALQGNTEIFKMLHAAGASILRMVQTPKETYAILSAIALSTCNDISPFLECLEDISPEHFTALCTTRYRGNYPIHDACLRKNPTFLKFLLARGADYSVINTAGKTPLQIAIEAKNSTAKDALIEHAAYEALHQ